jgi:hypothetical protein
MGLSSDRDWTGRKVNGVTLGFPVIIAGKCVWDGGVPEGTIDTLGDVYSRNPVSVVAKTGAVTAFQPRPELKILVDSVRLVADVLADQSVALQ